MLLVLGGIVMLSWNEKASIDTIRDIQDSRLSTLTLPCGATYSDLQNDSK